MEQDTNPRLDRGANDVGARRGRLPNLRRPRGRATIAFLSVVLILSGITLAVVNGATPGYRATTLAASGSFFALASSGDTIYAASDNGGSILLEESTDRGNDWSANPVPYSAVAGGAPWNYAAVAVDQGHLILAAATGGYVSQYPYTPAYPTASRPVTDAMSCGTNSTILVASSPDGGLTWATATFVLSNLSVTSLQAGIEGGIAAVAWLGETTSCTAQVGAVDSVTSRDGGQTWAGVQAVSTAPDSVPMGEGLEMAPESQGILIGFGLVSAASGTDLLSLWQLSDTGSGGFALTADLPAPASWTLQGDPGTTAYLLTPTYLIPLTAPPYTALPFNELQADGGGIGVLPRVVSLVATGPGQVEIAATTSDNLGVDCWQIDTIHGGVAQSCHVPIGSWLMPSYSALPIVALLDGGGWWVAIGASGQNCNPGCPSGGTVNPPTASSGGASVGTSVCVTGCSSASGLAAYAYAKGASPGPAILGALAWALVGVGFVALLAAAWWGRRRPLVDPPPASPEARSGEQPTGEAALPRSLRRTYLAGLGVWVLAWLPLTLVALDPTSGLSPSAVPEAILIGAGLGVLIGFPIHHLIRQRLQATHGVFEAQLLGEPAGGPKGYAFDRVRATSQLAYVSWFAALAVLVLLWMVLAGAPQATGSATAYVGPAGPSPTVIALVLAVLVFIGLRTLYHLGVERSVFARASSAEPPVLPSRIGREQLRVWLGAALLPWNPLVGLVLGIGLQSSLSWSPYLLAWAFLPVTLCGIALLSGGLGKTAWSPRFLAG